MEPGARREQGKFVVSRSTSSFAGCAGYRHTVVLRPTIGRFHEGTPNTPPTRRTRDTLRDSYQQNIQVDAHGRCRLSRDSYHCAMNYSSQ